MLFIIHVIIWRRYSFLWSLYEVNISMMLINLNNKAIFNDNLLEVGAETTDEEINVYCLSDSCDPSVCCNSRVDTTLWHWDMDTNWVIEKKSTAVTLGC